MVPCVAHGACSSSDPGAAKQLLHATQTDGSGTGPMQDSPEENQALGSAHSGHSRIHAGPGMQGQSVQPANQYCTTPPGELANIGHDV